MVGTLEEWSQRAGAEWLPVCATISWSRRIPVVLAAIVAPPRSASTVRLYGPELSERPPRTRPIDSGAAAADIVAVLAVLVGGNAGCTAVHSGPPPSLLPPHRPHNTWLG